MTTYTPGQRVHVNVPENPGYNGSGTWLSESDSTNYDHYVSLDSGDVIYLHDSEVTPIAEPKTLIENADWADAINALGEEMPGHQNRRYTITFEENEA